MLPTRSSGGSLKQSQIWASAMAIAFSRLFYPAVVATILVVACDVNTDGKESSESSETERNPRLSVEAARPIWTDVLRSALDSRLEVYRDYVILPEPLLGRISFVKKDSIIIQCDPLLGVEIIGTLGGDDMPAVSLGLVGAFAELDDPRYSVPEIAGDGDDVAVANLMKELCTEVADALDVR
jgi:hypothetical protein